MKTISLVLIQRAVCAALLGTALSACMSSTPYWDAHFGESARTSFATQVIDPQAGDRPQREVFSGKVGVSAMDSYDKALVNGGSGSGAAAPSMGSTMNSTGAGSNGPQ